MADNLASGWSSIQADDNVFRELSELNRKAAEMIAGLYKYPIEESDIRELQDTMRDLIEAAGLEQ